MEYEVKYELDPSTNFMRVTYNDGTSLAFNRYDLMQNGKDSWRPDTLDMTQWRKTGDYTYERI